MDLTTILIGAAIVIGVGFFIVRKRDARANQKGSGSGSGRGDSGQQLK